MSFSHADPCNTSILGEPAKIKKAKSVTIVTFSPETSHHTAFELLHLCDRLSTEPQNVDRS